MHRTLALIAAGMSLGVAAPAWACGGFFCNNDAPVDQSAERIVFAVDEAEGTVTTHVQITYAGSDPHDFAWVVPVPSQPELHLSTDRLFQELAWRYEPRFPLDFVEEGDCRYGSGVAMSDDMALESSAPPSDGAVDEAGGSVFVVEQSTVGPYDTVTLRADDTGALLTWLQENGYDLPTSLEPVLEPYVASESHFVALKLSSDRDTGDLAPLAMTYSADRAMIPIQLTSVAATPDMRLEAYVIGAERAVPENYLHVQINLAAIDWERGGANYEQVITLAADEAGGHAFATDFAGSTELMDGVLYSEGRFDLDALAAAADPFAFMDQLMMQGFPADDTLLGILMDHIPFPDALAIAGVEPQDFYNCIECYAEHVDGSTFDAAAATAELETFVVEPLQQAQAMFDAHPELTRLTSSISPVEMTVDPMFVFNPDMGDVEGIYTATLVTECGDGGDWYESPMELQLPNGLDIRLPSREWLEDSGLTIAEFIAELGSINAAVIEQTGSSGEPVVLTDHTASLRDQVSAFNEWVDSLVRSGSAGCGGCSAAGSSPAGLWALLLALGVVSRRRR